MASRAGSRETRILGRPQAPRLVAGGLIRDVLPKHTRTTGYFSSTNGFLRPHVAPWDSKFWTSVGRGKSSRQHPHTLDYGRVVISADAKNTGLLMKRWELGASRVQILGHTAF